MGNVPSADKQEQSDSGSKKTKQAKETKRDTVSNKQNNLGDDAISEMTNVGGYSMLYSMASDDDKPNPQETGEQKIETSPTREQLENQQLRELQHKKELMSKSKNSDQTQTPPSKQGKIYSVEEIKSEDTNVGGYTMLYSIAPDDDQPKPPATGECKNQASPIVEQEKNKLLEKSPVKADSMRKSKKSSKSLTPPSKQGKIYSVEEIKSEDTNVGGYTI
ncbi:hypothetical protein T11_8641, partial [Trichinella zimbabwensis]